MSPAGEPAPAGADWQFWLAVYGAALATLLALKDLRAYWLDRPRLKVTVRGGHRTEWDESELSAATFALISAVNEGRRPITVLNALLLLPGGEYAMVTDERTARTVEPTEGQPYQWLLNEAVLKGRNVRPDQYVAYVTDASGKRHYSHGPLLRRTRGLVGGCAPDTARQSRRGAGSVGCGSGARVEVQ